MDPQPSPEYRTERHVEGASSCPQTSVLVAHRPRRRGEDARAAALLTKESPSAALERMAGKKKIDDGDGDGARKLPRAESSASAASPAAAPATAAASACTPPADAAAEDFPTEDSLPHLCCNVCLTFPDGEVQQCSAGHILCRPCYDRVCRDLKPTCPTCRELLDLVRPIRNVLAEQSIALLRVA